MASCMHHGEGCSPEGTPIYKCEGYYECSFACEHMVCENHAHRSRYGVFCAQCDPSPPVFAMPKGGKQMHHLARNSAHPGTMHGASSQR